MLTGLYPLSATSTDRPNFRPPQRVDSTDSPPTCSTHSAIYYTTLPALTRTNFSLCETPGYALAVVYAPSDILPASSPVPRLMTCHKPKESLVRIDFLSVSTPGSPLTGNVTGGICSSQDPIDCYSSNFTLFMSISTIWEDRDTSGNLIPENRYNASAPRTLNIAFRESRLYPGQGNQTGCQVFPATTASVSTATATATSGPVTTTTTTTSRPAAGMKLGIGFTGLVGLLGTVGLLL